MKSTWHMHVELEKRIKKLKRRQEWIDQHGAKVRMGCYLGIGVVLALVMAIVAF